MAHSCCGRRPTVFLCLFAGACDNSAGAAIVADYVSRSEAWSADWVDEGLLSTLTVLWHSTHSGSLTLFFSLSLSLSLITFFLFPFCPITHFSHFLLAFSLLTHFDAHNKHSLVNICMQVNTHSPVSQEASQMCSWFITSGLADIYTTTWHCSSGLYDRLSEIFVHVVLDANQKEKLKGVVTMVWTVAFFTPHKPCSVPKEQNRKWISSSSVEHFPQECGLMC